LSNLPTVWSNCLAGWWLGGKGDTTNLAWVLAGSSLLYTGGMLLNDAFDEDFDREHRKERPIPSGAITARAVWGAGFALLLAGAVLLFGAGKTAGGLGLILAGLIVLYDCFHKFVSFAPVLMGSCRVMVYLLAAAAGRDGVTGWAVWGGLVLGCYIIGLSYLARNESLKMSGPLRFSPMLLLGAPLVLALCMNAEGYRRDVLFLCAIVGLWVLRCLRHTFWSPEPRIGATVSGLLAGIVLVDWLAVADVPREIMIVFGILFAASLLFQRFIPAT
jgi:4-hydroxybenzoate polyprenyltransferase